MRISPKLFALVLCAASIGVAHAQQNVVSPRGGGGSSRMPSGMSFAYDAQHGQISATGIKLSPAMVSQSGVSPTTGTIDVTINLKVLSRFGRYTSFRCAVYAIGGVLDLNNGTVAGGLETAGVNAKVLTGTGGNAVCTLSIPYSWTLPSSAGADSGLILAFAVAAVNEHTEVERSTLQLDGIENLPASGTVSKFVFDAVL